jgi:hypothetical protein
VRPLGDIALWRPPGRASQPPHKDGEENAGPYLSPIRFEQPHRGLPKAAGALQVLHAHDELRLHTAYTALAPLFQERRSDLSEPRMAEASGGASVGELA